ncbi:TPA: hypothetical protein ACGCHH_000356 [Stenotrophomonas maltophilia]
MQINVFEGARRISLLLSALAVVVAIWLAAISNPYVTANYRIYQPGAPIVSAGAACREQGSAEVHFETTTPKSRHVWVNVCLMAEQLAMDDGTTQGFIPLPPGPNGKPSWAYAGSEAVAQYKERIERSFVLPADEGQKLDTQFEAKRRKEWRDISVGLVGTLLVFWLGVTAVGWIVRGFAGIPRGQDSRPTVEGKK